MDEDGSAQTHHARWHSVRDLASEHRRCHDELKNGRESRKRAKVGEECPIIDGGEDLAVKPDQAIQMI